MTETKSDVIREITNLVSIPEYSTSAGSSIPRRFFSDLLDVFGLEDEGDSVTACKKIFKFAKWDWDSRFASENTPSGGGGTITLDGLKALRNVVTFLLDEIEFSDLHESQSTDLAKPDEWTLLRGQSILRSVLHDRYSGIRQGGISPSRRTNNIFIFTEDKSNNAHGYETDYWIDDLTFYYCGDGQTGDQEFTRRNLQILKHNIDGRKLRLFSPVAGRVTYLGELEIDSQNPYKIVDGVGRDGKQRKVIMFRLKRVLDEINHIGMFGNIQNSNTFGAPYKFANENTREISQGDLFAADPNLLDRALQIHSITQNTVANWVLGEGLFPLSPSPKTCDFDIAWESDFGLIVCEVKSLSDTNESHQFRLGIGQVLEYAHKIKASPLLMFSRRPKLNDLILAANRSGICVLWPEILSAHSPRDLRTDRAPQ